MNCSIVVSEEEYARIVSAAQRFGFESERAFMLWAVLKTASEVLAEK